MENRPCKTRPNTTLFNSSMTIPGTFDGLNRTQMDSSSTLLGPRNQTTSSCTVLVAVTLVLRFQQTGRRTISRHARTKSRTFAGGPIRKSVAIFNGAVLANHQLNRLPGQFVSARGRMSPLTCPTAQRPSRILRHQRHGRSWCGHCHDRPESAWQPSPSRHPERRRG